MNFIAIIPARYASTRFEGKPLVDIFGKPMVVRVYQRAIEIFSHVVVATDNETIKNKAKEFGCEVVMTDPNHPSGTDRCNEALSKAEILFDMKFDVVVNIQGDEPFIHVEQLEQIKKSFSDKDIDIATLVKPFGENEDIFNENTPKVVLSKSGRALYFSRSVIPFLRGNERDSWQDKHIFYKHIGLYAYRSNVLKEITNLPQGILEKCESLEQLRWLENGYQIKCEITTQESHAIDTPSDLESVLKIYKDKYGV